MPLRLSVTDFGRLRGNGPHGASSTIGLTRSGSMNKYHAQRVNVDGYDFHSKAEAARYWQLKQMERAGAIEQLELQPKYAIILNGKHVCNYFADFRYNQGGREVVEDVKGVRTAIYKLKKRLVEAVYNIKILET